MVNWDPGTGSAISDLEVEQRKVTDTLYYVDYPLSGGSGAITVATVRPETMLADSAIAVHPEDERYRRLIGESAILPLVGRKLKIIADEYVRPEFGTGALKITPAHDPNDFEIGRRHSLAQPSVIGENGRITEEAPEEFRGLTVAEAQKLIVQRLTEQGLLARHEPYEHDVPFSQRSGERIEPLISLQWFMRMDELAAPAVQVVKDGTVRFHPDSSRKIYLDWMENIRPWCISRQLWWGHQLPVWYRDLETYVGIDPPRGEGWTRDPDVLDTWFSSALWPFATLGWPDETPELAAFYPTDVLSTAREIINLWVARMLMMGIEFTGEVPFTDVNVHSVIQAPDGRRMSKSLGTGVDPIDLIEGGPRPPVFAQADGPGQGAGEFPAYGADALRWGLIAMSSGQDVRFSEDKVAQGQQLANKLWNASRLILMSIPGEQRAAIDPVRTEDRWILSRLQRMRATMDARIAEFDLPHAALELYDFVYGELCDWYLEIVKPRLREGDGALERTLLHVLTETITIAHPIIPFVTEEIWSFVPGAEGLLAARTVGDEPVGEIDGQVETALGNMIDAVQALRSWRNSAGVKPGATLTGRLRASGYEETAEILARLARIALDGPAETDADAAPVASVVIPGGVLDILPGGDLDLEATRRRRDEQRDRLQTEIDRAEKKLANPGFVSKAPPEVVQAERDKLARLKSELEAL
jgi:valyl-tRNA synthetase